MSHWRYTSEILYQIAVSLSVNSDKHNDSVKVWGYNDKFNAVGVFYNRNSARNWIIKLYMPDS
jgi:hypothetical protein